jgi:hypothetical protein
MLRKEKKGMGVSPHLGSGVCQVLSIKVYWGFTFAGEGSREREDLSQNYSSGTHSTDCPPLPELTRFISHAATRHQCHYQVA